MALDAGEVLAVEELLAVVGVAVVVLGEVGEGLGASFFVSNFQSLLVRGLLGDVLGVDALESR